MSNRQLTDTTIQIHPRALKALGLKKALVFLEVARDLRSGAIERDMYYQGSYGYECGSACCIYGHVDSRLFKSIKNRINRAVKLSRGIGGFLQRGGGAAVVAELVAVERGALAV